MSTHDARNIVLTRKEVESKLDKSHICLMPQDDGSIRVWLQSSAPICACIVWDRVQCMA